MFVFSVQYPDLFWRRTAGRLLGDSTIQEVLEDGSIVAREPTAAEQFQAFQDNLPVLLNNVKNVLFMFNWKGDVAWINNPPNIPQMDSLVGALFLLGLVAWAARMIRRRDVVDWLMPAALFLMLMPSALSIAYPVENPSATRTSGALPIAYLFAAYPLALMIRSVLRLTPARRAAITLASVLLALVMAVSYTQNARLYFERYQRYYLVSSLPYRQAGETLRDFNAEVGGKGNTFMIAYPYWWDHRALGIAAGLVDYPNGITKLEDVPRFMLDAFARQNDYYFEPDSDILFFHAAEDVATHNKLREWFPNGTAEFVEIEQQQRSYALYRVPALGDEAFLALVQRIMVEEGMEAGAE